MMEQIMAGPLAAIAKAPTSDPSHCSVMSTAVVFRNRSLNIWLPLPLGWIPRIHRHRHHLGE